VTDIDIADYTGGISPFLGKGDGTFTATGPLYIFGYPYYVALADINNGPVLASEFKLHAQSLGLTEAE
jgi:hypothetical protein